MPHDLNDAPAPPRRKPTTVTNASTVNEDGHQDGHDHAPPSPEDTGRVILLVEDNETDRQLYGRLLWYNGYSVLHAADGETAIALALESRPDLVLLDMVLEGPLTGLAVARRLREEGVRVPMVALSAKKREEFGSAIEEVGITSYLQKPIDPFAVVREVLRRIGGSDAVELKTGGADAEPGMGGDEVGEP